MRIALFVLLLLASFGDLVHAQVTRSEQVCSNDPFTRSQTCVSESYQAKPPSPPPPLTRTEIQEMERRDAEMARTAMRAHLEQVREDSKATPGSKPLPQGKHAPAGSKVT